ncbi:unnamed protein product [Caenorhabditis angaria]|uniref:Nanos-type domain-containing protein n=1 Tax=Caenorhabditis angaria TaxID=860376 RepID=A0A9P1I6S9_9PELO|nr:unnamed protein product [Caenorhabditis angaria]
MSDIESINEDPVETPPNSRKSSESSLGYHSDSERNEKRPKCCSFCWNLARKQKAELNLPIPAKDSFGVWSSHSLARFGFITCPLLWFHKCSICGATEGNAHTERNCPVRRDF